MVRTKSIKSLKKDLKFVESLTGGTRRKRRAHGFGADSGSMEFLKSQALAQIKKNATIKTQFTKLANDPTYQSVVKDPSKIDTLISQINGYIDIAKSLTPLPYKPAVIVAKTALNKVIDIAKKQFPPAQTVAMINGIVQQIVAN